MIRILTIAVLAATLSAGAAVVNSWTNVWNQTGYHAGDTNLLYGSFTNTSNQITNSGTAGNPITFYMMPGANFTAPYFDHDAGAIDPNNQSYIVIDGGSNGVIQNTACGTAFTNLASAAINGVLSHSVIRNLTITNIYVRSSYVDYPLYFQGGTGINLHGNDITISNCSLSQMGSGITLQPGADAANTNYIVVNNRLMAMNHFLAFSVPENTFVSNVLVAGNLFDHADVWDGGGGGNNLHMDYIIFQDGGGWTNAFYTRVQIYDNTFGANYTADLSVITNYPGYGYAGNNTWTNANNTASHGATAILAEYLNAGFVRLQNGFVFNNLILTYTNETWGNAPLSLTGSNVWMVNNSAVSLNGTNITCGGGFAIGGTNAYALNNIGFPGYGVVLSTTLTNINSLTVPDLGNGPNLERALTNYMTGVWSDKNIWPDVGGINSFSYFYQVTINGAPQAFGQQTYYGLPSWQTFNGNVLGFTGTPPFYSVHCDPNSTNGGVWYSAGTYIPTTNSIAFGTGSNLTAVASAYNVPQLLLDFNGTNRAATGNWTKGAFEAGYSAYNPPAARWINTLNAVNVFTK